jgi:hypothetical protein
VKLNHRSRNGKPDAPATGCMQSRAIGANCNVCGARPELVHMPAGAKGWYCEKCCPVCNPPAGKAGE